MSMKTWTLEKAQQYNDGTLGLWETSYYGGTPEVWHSYEKAVESADNRNMTELDGCVWRVADGWR